ncbi:hypothetical protein GM418_05455 [Maribellus comscasis]|uniref:Uncharacterized protein n=1 Tax=Maribellus comscasis TaxID=2681766 RepID=A0A6I6JUM4_9BACT|nr:hypothetical protein [Maribellus comscasis]QGY43123.1 hypothetical protein GM418_05455 [Maribellus comscasis]
MEKFDSNNFRASLISEFRELDNILETFQSQFKDEVWRSVNEVYPSIVYSEKLGELILTYANQIFSTAESVCDKDKNYNEVRLADEVNIMNKMVDKLSEENKDNQELAAGIHQKAKKMMVNFYPNVMDLSADGFRLLEKYSLMYNIFFIGGFSKFIAQ